MQVINDKQCRERALHLLRQLADEGILPGRTLEVLRYAAAHLHNLVDDNQQEDMKRATVEALIMTAAEVAEGTATFNGGAT